MLRTARTAALAGVLATAFAAMPSSTPASAANSPTFRDCSLLVDGIDADFVQISGVTVTPQGNLTVPPSQKSVQILASESSDPGDQSQGLTITVTVSAARMPVRVVSGSGIGRVALTVPLLGSGTGRTYTIDWQAGFDNGQHACPGPLTPDNFGPNPFVVTVG
jgi:hypothetical protein